jgi:hypothetical protein
MIYPIVVGTGRKLWDEGTTLKLTVADSFVSKSGVAVLTYLPA